MTGKQSNRLMQTFRLLLTIIMAFSMLLSANAGAFALAIPQTDHSKIKQISGEVYDASYTEWGIRGQVELANLAYNKLVEICYTYGGSEPVLIDAFLTTCGKASYSKASATAGKEIWAFDFRIPKTSAPNVQYAIKYTVNGATYWDNNFGKNYAMTPTFSGKTIRVYYQTANSVTNMHYQIGNGPWTTAPGIKMNASSYNGFVQLDIEIGSALKVTGAFNNGNNVWDNNGGKNFVFEQVIGNEREYTVRGTTITASNPGSTATQVPTATPVVTSTPTPIVTAAPTATPELSVVKIYYKASSAFVHYKVNNGTWTNAPGVGMINSEHPEYVMQNVTVPVGGNMTAAFNNGSNVWDNNGGKNYVFTPGTYTVANGQITSGAPAGSNSNNITTIYYPFTYTDRYGQIFLHYRVGNGAWTVAPGKLMSSSDVYNFNSASVDLGNASQLEFCIVKKAYYTDTNFSFECNGGVNYKVGKGNYTFEQSWDTNGFAWVVKAGKPGETVSPTATPIPTYSPTPTPTPTATPAVTPGATPAPSTTPQPQMITIYYKGNQANIHYNINNGVWTTAPGTAMTSSAHPDYLMTNIFVPEGGKVIAAFNDGKNIWDNNGGKNYTFTAGTFQVSGGVVTSGEPQLSGNEKIATIYYPHTYTSRYSYEYLHYRIGDGPWTTAPGKQLIYSDVYGFTYAKVNLGTADSLEFCVAVRNFYSDVNYSMNCNEGKNFIVGAGNFTFQPTYDPNGVYSQPLMNGKPGETTTPVQPPVTHPVNTITIYYAASANAFIHYKIDNGVWTVAPGKQMNPSNVNGYQSLTIDLGTSGNGITAAFNNGAGSWDNNGGKNYTFAKGTFTLKNGVLTSGTPAN